MKKLLILAAVASQFYSGTAFADNADADALIEQCRQEAIASGAEDIDQYISECLDTKLEYDVSE